MARKRKVERRLQNGLIQQPHGNQENGVGSSPPAAARSPLQSSYTGSPGSSNPTKARLKQSYNSTPASDSPEKARFRLDGEHRKQEVSPNGDTGEDTRDVPNTIEEFPTNDQPVMDTALKDIFVYLRSSLKSDLASYMHRFNNELQAV